MCPNCLNSIVMATSLGSVLALGGAGSAVVLAAAGLRFRTARAPELTHSNTEETTS